MCRDLDWPNIISCAGLAVFCFVACACGVYDVRGGTAALDRGDYDEAIRLFTSAIGSGDLSVAHRATAYNKRGNAWGKKKDYDRAIADYNEAIRLNPQLALAFNSRGNAWAEKKEYDHAIADYNEAIRLNPQYSHAFSNRGNAWSYKKDYDRAIADYNEAIRLDPKYADAFVNRGIACG